MNTAGLGKPDSSKIIRKQLSGESSTPANRDSPSSNADNTDTPVAKDSITTHSGSHVAGVSKLPDMPKGPKLLNTFLSTFDKNMKLSGRKNRPDPQQGAILMTGLVEVVGSRALVTLDVITDYDIEHETFMNLDIAVRSMRPTVQKPKGRPGPRRPAPPAPVAEE
jgi:hypothetical protein